MDLQKKAKILSLVFPISLAILLAFGSFLGFKSFSAVSSHADFLLTILEAISNPNFSMGFTTVTLGVTATLLFGPDTSLNIKSEPQLAKDLIVSSWEKIYLYYLSAESIVLGFSLGFIMHAVWYPDTTTDIAFLIKFFPTAVVTLIFNSIVMLGFTVCTLLFSKEFNEVRTKAYQKDISSLINDKNHPLKPVKSLREMSRFSWRWQIYFVVGVVIYILEETHYLPGSLTLLGLSGGMVSLAVFLYWGFSWIRRAELQQIVDEGGFLYYDPKRKKRILKALPADADTKPGTLISYIWVPAMLMFSLVIAAIIISNKPPLLTTLSLLCFCLILPSYASWAACRRPVYRTSKYPSPDTTPYGKLISESQKNWDSLKNQNTENTTEEVTDCPVKYTLLSYIYSLNCYAWWSDYRNRNK